MDTKTHFDLETLRLIYRRYKVFQIPFLVIFISAAVFLKIVLPQTQGVIGAKEEAKKASQRISVLKSNLDTLSRISEDVLDTQTKILTSFLPLSKDFWGVLDSLSKASQDAGVSLDNYEFKVGDLSKDESVGKKAPSLELSLTVVGDIDRVRNFIKILETATPLSEVTDVEIGNISSTIKAVFYYKSIAPPVYADTMPINSLSQKDISFIENLRQQSVSF